MHNQGNHTYGVRFSITPEQGLTCQVRRAVHCFSVCQVKQFVVEFNLCYGWFPLPNISGFLAFIDFVWAPFLSLIVINLLWRTLFLLHRLVISCRDLSAALASFVGEAR